MELEYLDIVDKTGEPTGSIVERSIAHAYGIPHHCSHVWLFRFRNSKPQLLLQKRSGEKDSFPGCYDISSAGHIPAGDDYISSALRELKEELGVDAKADELRFCGSYFVSVDSEFNGREFHDREFAMVYLLELDRSEESFTLQREDVESVMWMDLDRLLTAVRSGSIPNCLVYDELLLLAGML